VNHKPNRHDLLVAAVIVALLLCYAGVLVSIVRVWSTNYLYSYGFAVPLISGYMLWARAEALRRASHGPDYLLGSLVTGTGAALLLVGHLGAVESVESLSIVVTAVGAILLLFGRGVVRVAWFPIVYLVLGIPVWDRLIGNLQVPSQQLSASIAVRVLHLARVPAIQDQTFIALPNLTLEVLQECSGVNQLISVATMSLAAAYLWLRGPLRRATFVAIAVGIAYVSNGIRIALVGFLGYHHLSNGRLGVLHLAEGLAVSLAGYVVIFACLSLLTPGRRMRLGQPSSPGELTSTSVRPPIDLPRFPSRDFAIVAVLLCIGLFRLTFHAPAVHLNSDLALLPLHFSEWAVIPGAESGATFRLAGADNELLRAYRHSSGDTVRLYVGYQQYQSEGKELVSGRDLRRGTTSRVRLPRAGELVELAYGVHAQTGARTAMLLWYDVNGRILTNFYLAKGYTIWNGLTRGRTNAAVIRIEWDATFGDHWDRSRERVLAFADAIIPFLRASLPSPNNDAHASSATPQQAMP
jgi:EpsI family protein